MAKVLRHRWRVAALACLALLLNFGCWEEDTTCKDDGRQLTDAELLESAFAYEVNNKDLPEPYLSLGLSGMREIYPGCCFVMRADDPNGFTDPNKRGVLSRLFSDPYYFALINWDLSLGRPTSRSTTYQMSLCGRVSDRGGDFRPRNYDN
jgi:hypothetical protein